MHYPITNYMHQNNLMQNLRNKITQHSYMNLKITGKAKIECSTTNDSMNTKVDSIGNAIPDKD